MLTPVLVVVVVTVVLMLDDVVRVTLEDELEDAYDEVAVLVWVAVVVRVENEAELDVVKAVEVAVEDTACGGRKRLAPKPRPIAESIAITAPTAICLLSWDISKNVRIRNSRF